MAVDAQCVTARTTPVRADLTADAPGVGRATWVLRGPGADRTGTVNWSLEDQEVYGSVSFTLRPGRYRLTITRVDCRQIVADQVFDVLRCVTAKASCRAVTFRNPAGNRPVRVEYAGSGYLADRSRRTLTIESGRSATVRTYAPELVWDASGPLSDFAGKGTGGDGNGEVVPQHCGPLRTRGVVGCVTGRRGLLRAWFHPPDDRLLRYRVEDFYALVSKGHVGRDRHLRLWLKPGASYAFYSSTGSSTGFSTGAPKQPYDRVDRFEVVPCVIARARAGAVRFRNPTSGTVRIGYRVVGVQDKIVIRLRAGQARTVSVPPGELCWHTNALRTATRWRTDRGRGTLHIDG